MAKCKKCKNTFIGKTPKQKYCMDNTECISSFLAEIELNKQKAFKRETILMKEKLMSVNDWLKRLTIVFNKYIRLRDKNLKCISCGNDINGTGHASHFFSSGNYPYLRFNEYNVNLSCHKCNTFLHGNLIEYSIRIKDKIGLDKYNELEFTRNTKISYTISDIKEMINHYKSKIKNLNDR